MDILNRKAFKKINAIYNNFSDFTELNRKVAVMQQQVAKAKTRNRASQEPADEYSLLLKRIQIEKLRCSL